MARYVWFWMIWLARRPLNRRAELFLISLLPAAVRGSAKEEMLRRSRFFRKIGLRVMTFMMNIVLAALLLSITARVAFSLMDSGMLTVPEEVKARINQPSDSDRR